LLKVFSVKGDFYRGWVVGLRRSFWDVPDVKVSTKLRGLELEL
jgi:hypothetical protein